MGGSKDRSSKIANVQTGSGNDQQAVITIHLLADYERTLVPKAMRSIAGTHTRGSHHLTKLSACTHTPGLSL
jgi:hypothetical protein